MYASGLSPHNSFLVLQATAAAARATCGQVADLIAYNPGWHLAFPHVVRDKEGGWSMSRGFEEFHRHMHSVFTVIARPCEL